MLNCLVRVKEGEFINHLGMIVRGSIHDEYCIVFSFKKFKWFRKEMFEVLSKEPQFNHFGRLRCYWCNTNLKYYKKDILVHWYWNIYYCPKCLR